MLRKIGREKIGKLVVYGSDQTHSALQKAAKIAGIHPDNFRAVKTTKKTSYALSPSSLRQAIQADLDVGLVPFFLCVTVGTTSTTAVDPVGLLSDVAKDYGIWAHVDAAYAGSACICPEFRHFIDGLEGVDSFSFNAHKWFFTSMDCCCLWVKEPSALIKSLSTYPEYLKNSVTDSKQVVDYKDWQINLSRRFRALKLWLVLRSYGVPNLRAFLRSHVSMAQLFEKLVSGSNRFEIVVPRNFAMVCFRVSPAALALKENGVAIAEGELKERANHLNRRLLEAVNASGQVFMTHAMVEGVYMIRFAVGATLTAEHHVIMAWKIIQQKASTLFSVFSVY